MRTSAVPLVAWVAYAALLAPTHLQADPRGIGEPPPPLTPELIEARRVQLSVDMADWVPRLVGRFAVDGVADFNGIKDPPDPLLIHLASGKADCVAIGRGPGVHCVFHVSWIAEWNVDGTPVDGGEPFLAPAMKLFGLEPDAPLIHQLQLDTDGVAELESTSLKGNTVRWIYETRCESETDPAVRCRRITRFHAPAGSNRIQLVIEFEQWVPLGNDWIPMSSFALDMVRQTEEQVAATSGTPAGSGKR